LEKITSIKSTFKSSIAKIIIIGLFLKIILIMNFKNLFLKIMIIFVINPNIEISLKKLSFINKVL
jgi:hypothetical protein